MKALPAALAAIIITTGVAAQEASSPTPDGQETAEESVPTPLRVPPPAPPPPPSPPAPNVPDSMAADMPEGANVIVYRFYAEPTAWAATVKIDGEKLAAIGNKKWTAVKLEPGTYEFRTSWPIFSGQSGGRHELTVEEGETYFLEIRGVSRSDGMYITTGSGIGEYTGPRPYERIAGCCSFKEPRF